MSAIKKEVSCELEDEKNLPVKVMIKEEDVEEEEEEEEDDLKVDVEKESIAMEEDAESGVNDVTSCDVKKEIDVDLKDDVMERIRSAVEGEGRTASLDLEGKLNIALKDNVKVLRVLVVDKGSKDYSVKDVNFGGKDDSVANTTRFKCEYCGKQFKFRSQWVEHTAIHTKKKTFECAECGKRFTRIHSLSQHQLRAKVNGTECDKQFSNNCNFNSQKLTQTHKEVKEFVCNICNKTYKRASSLRYHSVIHTGKKDFECDQCGKTFHYERSLTEHSLVHTTRKFRCDICDAAFFSKRDVRKHIQRRHTVRWGNCTKAIK